MKVLLKIMMRKQSKLTNHGFSQIQNPPAPFGAKSISLSLNVQWRKLSLNVQQWELIEQRSQQRKEAETKKRNGEFAAPSVQRQNSFDRLPHGASNFRLRRFLQLIPRLISLNSWSSQSSFGLYSEGSLPLHAVSFFLCFSFSF